MPVLSTDGNADAALLDAGAKAIDGLTFSNSVCTAEGDPEIQAFYDDYHAANGKDPSSYVAVIGYDEVNLVADAITKAGSADAAPLIAQLAKTDYTGISGHVVMDPTTRRANKPAALIQMKGTEFTCLGQPAFPSYVPAPQA
jgi:branched-chain amino acid transport system substrate-binding protein